MVRRRTPAAGLLLLLAACGPASQAAGAPDGSAPPVDVEVRPFSEVQDGEILVERDALDPSRAILRVVTTEPMICAIVWGETEEYGRFNNSLAMSGTGITDHDVILSDVDPDRTYHFIVQGTTADGTLYRSEPMTFALPALEPAPDESTVDVDVGANLALDATVVDVSSEFSAGFGADLAVDDDLATEWSTAGDGDDGWITLDLGEPSDVLAVEFVTRSMADGSAITSTFTLTIDDADPLGPFPAASPAVSRPAIVEVTGKLLRFDVAESSGGNVGAVEIRVFAPPD